MTRYTPSGKGSRILAALEGGPATAAELITAATGNGDRKARSKGWRVLNALKLDELIRADAGFYFITQAGGDALTCLRCGQTAVVEIPQTSFRVFAERRAA